MTTRSDPESLIRRVLAYPKTGGNIFLDSFAPLYGTDGALLGVEYFSPSVSVSVEARLLGDEHDCETEQSLGAPLSGNTKLASTGPNVCWRLHGWQVWDTDVTNKDFYLAIARASVPPVEETACVPMVEYEAIIRHRVATFAHQVALQEAQHQIIAHFSDSTDIHVAKAGGWLPFQAEGLIDGEPFYFRYRTTAARLQVGGTDPVSDPRLASEVEDGGVFFDQGNHMMQGFVEAMKVLVPALEPVAKLDWQIGVTR